MINIKDREHCCGCTACKSICPHNAIKMQADGLGFLYPAVNMSLCKDCGLCDRVCEFNSDYDRSFNLSSPIIYAVRHRDLNEVKTSRSGAAFIALSDWILAQNGVVYGAGYTDHFRVVHKRATSAYERNEFKGSKYVQSDLNETFVSVKKDLLDGRKVMFSGTPCQTSGLASFIDNKLRANLYLVDIVCHGVPSPYIWRDYIKHIENKRREDIISLDFRDKSELGWAAHQESFTFPSGKIYKHTFTHLFYEHIMFRPSCKVCHFTNFSRPSDLTLGDYWGWQNTDPIINKDDRGVSLLFCNTKKGLNLFNSISHSLFVKEVDKSQCLQPNLQNPSVFHADWLAFENDYISNGFEFIAKKYGDMGLKYLLKRILNKLRTLYKMIFVK